MLEALKMGLSIPDDVSITGFDDLELSAELAPALTSVHVNAARMGETAASALVSAVDNDNAVQSQQLPTHLVIRQSSGPAQMNKQRSQPKAIAAAARTGNSKDPVREETTR